MFKNAVTVESFFKQFYHFFVDEQLKMEVFCDDVKTSEEIRSYLQNSIFDGLQYFMGEKGES